MITGKPTRQLATGLHEIFGVSSMLLKDVHISLETLLPLVTSSEAENGYPKKVAFWTRTTIRCFIGLLDGLSFSMRKAVLRCAQDAGLTLTHKEQESRSRTTTLFLSRKWSFSARPPAALKLMLDDSGSFVGMGPGCKAAHGILGSLRTGEAHSAAVSGPRSMEGAASSAQQVTGKDQEVEAEDRAPDIALERRP